MSDNWPHLMLNVNLVNGCKGQRYIELSKELAMDASSTQVSRLSEVYLPQNQLAIRRVLRTFAHTCQTGFTVLLIRFHHFLNVGLEVLHRQQTKSASPDF